MKDKIATYKIWAPEGARWVQWAKPVLFASLPAYTYTELARPAVNYIAPADYTTAVIVDLPGRQSVEEGMALARLGLRPVPVYNGVHGPGSYSMVVDVSDLTNTLFHAAYELETLPIRADAPPAFLLDANRMNGGKQKGRYDNRWCVFAQDLPSAAALQKMGITRVVVRTGYVQDDLSHVLLRYQKAGIQILRAGDGQPAKPIEVAKPSRFKSFLYRASVTVGLTRNAAGGFGGQVPEPMESTGTGVRYYGTG